MLRSNTLIGLLMLTGILVVGQLYIMIPMFNSLADFFSSKVETASWAGTTFGLSYAFGFLIFGPLSDKFGRRRVLIYGLITLGLATLALSFTESMPQFLLGRIVQGFLAASFPPVALSLITETLPLHKRVWGVAMMSFAFLIAAPLAQFFSAEIDITPTKVMLFLSPFYFLMALTLARYLPIESTCRKENENIKITDSLNNLLNNKLIICGWFSALTIFFGFISFQVSIEALSITSEMNAQTIRLIGLPPLTFSIFSVLLLRKITPSKVGMLGILITAIGLVLATIPSLIILSAIMISSGVALGVPGLISTISEAANDYNRGIAMSLYTFFLFIGASIASPIATALLNLNVTLLFWITTLLLIISIMSIITSVAWNKK